MPQRRQFHTSSKKHKKVPESAEDWITAASEYEEAGDRWRPGDRPKAGRFYNRAIEAYTSAARTPGPTLFYALFNRARLQFELSQHPDLVPSLSRSERWQLLEKALEWNQEALRLKPEDQDAIFMTAQSLCTVGEALAEEGERGRARSALEQAAEGFEKCAGLQRAEIEMVGRMEAGEMDTEQGGVALPPQPEEAPKQEEPGEKGEREEFSYADVSTPATLEALQDTLLALLYTYTVLVPLLVTEGELRALTERVTALTGELPREEGTYIPIARARLTLAEAHHTHLDLSLAAWEETVTDAFKLPEGVEAGAMHLCEKADAHRDLAVAVFGREPRTAWKHLAFAARELGEASKLEPTKARIYMDRGDVEVLRIRIPVEEAAKARPVLAKNAGVFYRGAQKLGDAEEKTEGAVKEKLVEMGLEGPGEAGWNGVEGVKIDVVRRVVAEAVGQGVFGSGWLDWVQAGLQGEGEGTGGEAMVE